MRKYHFFVIYLVLWIFLWSIYSWTNNYLIENKNILLNNYYDKEVFVIWKVEYLYKKEENYNSYIVKLLSIDDKNIKVKFLLKTSNNIIFDDNSIISFSNKINKIDNFQDNFNYKKFMLSKWVYFASVFPYDIKIGWKNENILDKIIYKVRQEILIQIKEIYPRNEWDLLAGILIWARENISKDMMLNFNNSWLTHLMAVSWFNITIIIIFLWFLFKFIPVYFRFILITLFVVFFTLIVWDNVAVLRASIMWILAYFILISWRKADSLSIIIFTAFVLVLFNPLYLNYDISYHLSFLAVLWLLYTKTFWDKIFFFLPRFFAVKESFVLTMSALTTTLPIMIFSFWKISFLSPVSNMLVWWIIPISMLLWLLSILWNIIHEKIWFILWFPTYFLLKFVNIVAEYFWNLSFSVFEFNYKDFFPYLEISYFLILIFLIVYFQKENLILEKEKKDI